MNDRKNFDTIKSNKSIVIVMTQNTCHTFKKTLDLIKS